ncbi:hypothetical protein GCM10010885_12890 [Alicyclobacillus cellulosilyticus]|uniref:Response regulatory domain-containing protein n=1 Tax=Alicyclobacillus cellulosilyticus TaxID=1003997 RepID=A0A917KCB0_9BACL|nr:response regulator transcription factor [Alicyclobacillus cellulosilyticus]GGJ05224.1 hypothetical protein GCM10010885_12890 [Alicyclobacillus cellulosilyticus]
MLVQASGVSPCLLAAATAGRPVRVGVTDDNEPFRETLTEILSYEPDIDVVASWPNAVEALAGLDDVQPDIVLLDVDMPFLRGLDAVSLIRAERPAPHVIMLSMHDDLGYVLHSLQAGASGYVVKDGSAKGIVQAIRDVMAGRLALYPDFEAIPGLLAGTLNRFVEVSRRPEASAKPASLRI